MFRELVAARKIELAEVEHPGTEGIAGSADAVRSCARRELMESKSATGFRNRATDRLSDRIASKGCLMNGIVRLDNRHTDRAIGPYSGHLPVWEFCRIPVRPQRCYSQHVDQWASSSDAQVLRLLRLVRVAGTDRLRPYRATLSVEPWSRASHATVPLRRPRDDGALTTEVAGR